MKGMLVVECGVWIAFSGTVQNLVYVSSADE
jgi:hypothetical protein